MGSFGKRTAAVVMLMLPPFLSACQRTPAQSAYVQEGKSLFTLWCAQCHAVVRNDERVAPDLAGVGLRLSPRLLKRMIERPSLSYPGTIMPPDEHFSPRERGAVVAYLTTLRDNKEARHPTVKRIMRTVKAILAKLRPADA